MLFGLGIRHVGKTTGEQLASAFPSMAALMEATEEQLAEVDGIGGVIAQSIRAFFANKDNREVIRRLERMGVSMEDATAGEEVPQTLAGITFVLTGSLVESGMTRDEAGARLKAMGAKVSGTFPRRRGTWLPAKPREANMTRRSLLACPCLLRLICFVCSRPARLKQPESRRVRRSDSTRGFTNVVDSAIRSEQSVPRLACCAILRI